LSDLYEQANYRVNGSDSKVNIQVRAAPGSFVIELAFAVGRAFGGNQK
jgi:hypothetical protein